MSDVLFESVKSNTDYNDVCGRVLYHENKEIIKDSYTEEEFLKMDDPTKKKIADDLKLNFKFILTFGVSITAFFPIVESFIINSGIDDIHLDKSTVVYLGICALAIAFDNPKESYRKLFSELRLRNVYGLLKDLTAFIGKLKDIFNYIISTVSKITYDIVGMFNYTALFVPFALTVANILNTNNITVDAIVSEIGDNAFMKLSSIAIGVSGITLREFITHVAKNLSKFTFQGALSKSFAEIRSSVESAIKSTGSKIDPEKINAELKLIEVRNNIGGDILKWDQWKDLNDLPSNVERIDEES